MTLVEEKTFSRKMRIGLSVELESETVIAVRAGKFRAGGKDLEFLEDQLWEFRDSVPVKTYVTGYVVTRKDNGQPVLLVDDLRADGEDTSYKFEGSPYQLHHRLFRLVIPPAAENLLGTTITVNHVVPIPKPVKEVKRSKKPPSPEPEDEDGGRDKN